MIKLLDRASDAMRVRPADIQDAIARILPQLTGSKPPGWCRSRWTGESRSRFPRPRLSIGAGEGIPPVSPFRLDTV